MAFFIKCVFVLTSALTQIAIHGHGGARVRCVADQTNAGITVFDCGAGRFEYVPMAFSEGTTVTFPR